MMEPGELLRARLTAQLLAGERPADPVDACRHLLAIQGQDARGFRLAIRARTGLTEPGPLLTALAERCLVVSWVNRGTLHLVGAADFWWLHALTTPQLRTGSIRRLGEEGVTPDVATRAVGLVDRWLAEAGPLTRAELRARLQGAGLPTAGQALIHILFRAGLDGVLVRGPVRGAEQAFVRLADWLGPPPRFDRDQALAELARRYLAAHGPATDRDLARWAALPLRDARAGLAMIAPALTEREGLVALRDARPAAALPAPMLLGSFEPLLLGWSDRSFITGSREAVLVRNGIFRAFALVGGRAGALWRLDRGRVVIEPLRALGASERDALDREGQRVRAYLAAELGAR